ncbi:MAG: Linear gramicidin synthase subunit B [Chroococcopsis gigantea SAG 12.99]|nr:Linear gramicidin synthase subunit B [Chroococcopsis gigantea SAG 12.99]
MTQFSGNIDPVLEQRIAKLSPAKRAILEQRLQQKNPQGNSSVLPAEKENRRGLSLSQKRIWLLDRIDGGNPAYNRPANIRLAGKLDVDILERSLNKVIERHEVLRSNFHFVGERPEVSVTPHLYLPLSIVDFSFLPDGAKVEQLQDLAFREAQTVFNLEQDFLIKATLVKLDKEQHILLLTIHHIVFDGWSMGILLEELTVIYRAFITDKSCPLPELAIQYYDFAHWQEQRLRATDLKEKLVYWKQRLTGELPILQLFTDKPRPPMPTFSGSRYSFNISDVLTTKIKKMSQEQGATLFMTLLTAFKVLLYRYTGQEDLIICCHVSGRNRLEIENLLGVFINTLPLRSKLYGNFTFPELLAQVRRETLEAYEYQDVPFEKIVEEINPPRNINHTPIFQVLFQLRNFSRGKIETDGLTFEEFKGDQILTAFDVTLDISEVEKGLSCSFEYNSDLWESITIERMAGHFENLLSAIVSDPRMTIARLPLLSQRESRQLLTRWNDTSTPYPQDKCIHQLFEEQVRKTPSAIAAVYEKQCLTYEELNRKANQLARYLRSLGVKPEVLVGIYIERSLEMVIGLLGILKAGGAYVPLDPSYPAQRLNYMLDDSQVRILLTAEKLKGSLDIRLTQIVCLDKDWEIISSFSADNLDTEISGNNLAYVIYTSGSTGNPKGVMNTHKGIRNRLLWMQDVYGLTCDDRVLQKTPFGFDVSVWEFFWPLITGAKILLANQEGHKYSDYLVELIITEQITTIHFVPSMLQVFLQENGVKKCISLKRVFCSGEELQSQQIKRFFEHLECELHNLYGPTEAAIDVTFWQCQARENFQTVPIGRPIANTQIYILDEQLQPVPIGVKGELYIGGDNLARGYLNRPELTAEKFIPSPFQTGKRLYRTGDLARHLPDGNIEYIGRIDSQIKIRGVRIELGEVEAVLNSHPSIEQAVVICREDIAGEKRLVAYVVAGKSLDNYQLTQYQKGKLPPYMVPSAIVFLDSMPLTPNGKIDRKSLPSTGENGIESENHAAAGTPRQEIIANIFASVLKVQAVGINENFFELGGHSLLAAQVISRLREALKKEIPLRTLFETGTVAQLDRLLHEYGSQEESLNSTPLLPVARNREAYPLSFAQERLWFIDQLEGVSATYNVPIAVRLTGDLYINALERALKELVQRHESLRTSFKNNNGQPEQVIHPEAELPTLLEDLQHLENPERVIKEKLFQEVCTGFELKSSSLLRYKLWRLSADEYVLAITMHHIITDGWSLGVFCQELSILYGAFIQGLESPLPPLTIQYLDYALWQRQMLQGEVGRKQLAYWIGQLSGIPELLQLPTDRTRPSVQTYRGKTVYFNLASELIAKLQKLSQESGATLFMTLLTAFAILLYRYSGEKDIIIGSPIANRQYGEIEPLIGFFVNTSVYRVNLESNPDFLSLLYQVRKTTLEAYENQDVPFEQVVSALQPQRSLSHTPLFQVMFDLQDAPLTQLALSGLTCERLDLESTSAKFDLTVSMLKTSAGLTGRWQFNSDLFDEATIERMAGHFQNLLEAIVNEPGTSVHELPLLTEKERHQLLTEWNHTGTPYPQDKCIHGLFEERVKKTPDAIAAVFEDKTLTYEELNHYANRLAAHLRSSGVTVGVLVGICVEPSLDMVIGLLGILKAGAAYVPLDPSYPVARLSYMLADAKVRLLLTQAKLLPSLPVTEAKIFCLDGDWQTLPAFSTLDTEVSAENLAYVIYTSGSTGEPKGVAVPHRAIHRLVLHTNYIRLNESDRIAVVSNISFDAATFEIWGALLNGGQLVIIPKEVLLSPGDLAQVIAQKQISVMFITTALFNGFAQTIPSAFQSLRYLLFGGERVDPQSVRAILGDGGPGELLHVYGPTEGTTFSSYYPVRCVPEEAITVPIGKPIANTEISLPDERLQPVPAGVAGEIYIGGDGLALGYLHRPGLTGEKFIYSPFSAGERLYKTGDIARYLPDGNIEYIARIDNQVKIRGFRIELGEIESALNQHPEIQQSVAVVKEYGNEDKQIIAYYLTRERAIVSNQELRSFLVSILPSYMLPSLLIKLDKLVLNPNGKIERKALLRMDLSNPINSKLLTPRNGKEEKLVKIWSEFLPVKEIGIEDNFFELGGHSLLAVKIVMKIEEIFGRKMPLRYLFQYPTIAQLATILETENADFITSKSIFPIQTKGSKPPLFLIHVLGRGLNFCRPLASHLGSEQPVYGLNAQIIDREFTFSNSVEDWAAHYIEEMRKVQPRGPYLLGGISFGGLIAYEMAQQLQSQGEKVALLVLFDTVISSARKKLQADERLSKHWSNLRETGFDYFWNKLLAKIQGIFLKIKENLTAVFNMTYFKIALKLNIPLPDGIQDFIFARENFLGYLRYSPSVYSGSVNIFCAGTRSHSVSYSLDPLLGWGPYVNGKLEMYPIPSTHLGILQEPEVQIVAEKLTALIEEALEKG